MRKLTLFFILFVVFNNLISAQQERFYAIDGSEWVSEKDRDAREETLWDEVSLHIDYIKKRKLHYSDLAENYSQIMPLFKDLFASCREVNAGFKDIVMEKGEEFRLIKDKVKLNTARASNKEMFYVENLRLVYNIGIDQFDIVSTHLKDIVNYDLGISDERPTTDLERFAKNGADMEILGKDVIKTTAILKEAVKDYNKKEKPALKGKSSTGVSGKKDIYYAFDGREYKTLKGRDNYEQRLKDKYNRIFAMAETNGLFKDQKNAEDMKTLIFGNFDLMKKVRSFNETVSFLEDDEIKKKIKSMFPRKNLTTHTARNKELCYIKEIHDVYEPLLGIFEIYASVLEYLEDLCKENIKAKKKGEDNAVVSISMDIEDQKDSKGFSHKELMEKVNKAAKILSPAYSELVSFYEREKRNLK